MLIDATIKAKIAGALLNGGVSALVAQDHAKFAPAACAKLVGSVGGDLQTLPTQVAAHRIMSGGWRSQVLPRLVALLDAEELHLRSQSRYLVRASAS